MQSGVHPKYNLIKGDYSDVDSNTRVATTEVKGLRSRQEDQVIAGNAPGFESLEEKDRITVLNATVAVLESEIESYLEKTVPNYAHRSPGSTLSAVMTCGDKIYTTLLGDSTPFLVVKEEKEITLQKLYDRTHNVADLKYASPEEQKKYAEHTTNF